MADDYSKLKVPELKTLCKEKGITGYSKLGRQALIDKLNESASSAQTPASSTPNFLHATQTSAARAHLLTTSGLESTSSDASDLGSTLSGVLSSPNASPDKRRISPSIGDARNAPSKKKKTIKAAEPVGASVVEEPGKPAKKPRAPKKKKPEAVEVLNSAENNTALLGPRNIIEPFIPAAVSLLPPDISSFPQSAKPSDIPSASSPFFTADSSFTGPSASWATDTQSSSTSAQTPLLAISAPVPPLFGLPSPLSNPSSSKRPAITSDGDGNKAPSKKKRISPKDTGDTPDDGAGVKTGKRTRVQEKKNVEALSTLENSGALITPSNPQTSPLSQPAPSPRLLLLPDMPHQSSVMNTPTAQLVALPLPRPLDLSTVPGPRYLGLDAIAPKVTNKSRPKVSLPPSKALPRPKVPIVTSQSSLLVTTPTPAPARKSLLPASKPFRPLVFKSSGPRQPNRPLASPKIAMSMFDTHLEAISYHLDFPRVFTSSASLADITRPPRLALRAQTAQMAIILSTITDADRRNCVLVCKTWRYAVYLSAQVILSREFSGDRLARVYAPLKGSQSLAHTNVWSYLRQRLDERQSRRTAYEKSFLARIIQVLSKGKANFVDYPIHRILWTSPDCDLQTTIALRFVLHRLWVALNLRDTNAGGWLDSAVVDVQPWGVALDDAADADVWLVILRRRGSQESKSLDEKVFVLAATGEVLGHPPADPFVTSEEEARQGTPLRADWSRYIASLSSNTGQRSRLIDRVSWTNAEEFLNGISRHWLKRVEGEGKNGAAKKRVAERYILASVVGNSVSGSFLTSMEMAQEFNGNPSTSSTIVKKPVVSLYVPEHHYVESVHFNNPAGNPLHAAVAVIQTPGREYYILRDTGLEIGSEENGIYIAWMDVIRCSAQGTAV